MRLEDLYRDLRDLDNNFNKNQDWHYARKVYEVISNFEDEYKQNHYEYAGYSENLIRIRGSILMVDRAKGTSQYKHGISSIMDIIERELKDVKSKG
ncbi:hypothetical protein DHD05_18475 [Arenibacter sp. N53]|uniref:hypothetical protein n=1 Tax=Arenibacter TaxID=178469 RepID=UPI000CD3BF19|nr:MULTISPECIES: hypothetical protein [Arenibacter]MCM4153583.1 hypothetical protein [Arenibacter sp. N53]